MKVTILYYLCMYLIVYLCFELILITFYDFDPEVIFDYA